VAASQASSSVGAGVSAGVSGVGSVLSSTDTASTRGVASGAIAVTVNTGIRRVGSVGRVRTSGVVCKNVSNWLQDIDE
jgi:hypothetical protein